MPGRVTIIANPVSGGGRGAARARALADALTAIGLQPELVETTPDRDGTAAAKALPPDAERRAVAVVGGDGSVADVLNGLAPDSPPVAVLPSGTANVWAQAAALPRDAGGCAAAIAASHTIETRLARCGERLFFLFAGAGVDARIVERVEVRRARRGGKGGMRQWLWPTLCELWGRPQADLAATVDGRRIEGLGQVLVTRVGHYANGIRLPAGIDPRDDCLHIVAIPRCGPLRYLSLGAAGRTGRLRPSRHLIHLRTDGPVTIDSPVPEPAHLDGDGGFHTPLHIALTDRRVRLVVGEARHEAGGSVRPPP